MKKLAIKQPNLAPQNIIKNSQQKKTVNQILVHLKAIQYRLMKNNIDNLNE